MDEHPMQNLLDVDLSLTDSSEKAVLNFITTWS